MQKKYSGYIYIVLCALIFSTMEVMLKKVSGVFAPMQITDIRFLVGGILLIPFAVSSLKKKGAKITLKDIGFFAVSGFLCVAFSMVLYQMAVVYTKASVVAVIFSCNPIFVTFLAAFFLKEEIRWNHIAALILEAVAILIIVSPWNTELSTAGVVLSILSALVFAAYSVFGKKHTPKFGGIAVTCFSFLFGSVELLIVLLLGRTAAVGSLFNAMGLTIFVDVPLFEGIPASALPYLFYICAINSAAGYICHMLALEKTSAKEASLIFFLKPMIAPVIALLLLHEVIPFNMLIGIAFFMVGAGTSILPGLIEEKKKAKA